MEAKDGPELEDPEVLLTFGVQGMRPVNAHLCCPGSAIKHH